MTPILILDNGASTIKAGFANNDEQPRLVPNAVVKSKGGGSKLYIGQDIETCDDFFGIYYRRPFERASSATSRPGILTDWDTEKAVWDNLFSPECLNVDTRATSLLVTEPYFNLPSVQDTYDQLVFEEYEFKSYLRTPAAPLAQYGPLFAQRDMPPPECYILVDSGFSFTHVIPVMKGKVLTPSIKRLVYVQPLQLTIVHVRFFHRIDIGGKLLTNYLKEIVSFRHWDMMEHFYVMNEVKEKCCFVSSSFSSDLESCRLHPRRNPIVQEYVLPDFGARMKGYIRSGPNAAPRTSLKDSSADPSPMDLDGAISQSLKQDGTEPVLYMANERFTVPEVLFHPSDIGLHQSGLPETIAKCIYSLNVPDDIRGLFWANIGLVGGNFCMEGIVPRLKTELRALAPPEAHVGIYEAKDPVTATFESLHSFSPSTSYSAKCVTKEEYLEGGTNMCRRKFTQNWELGFDLGNDAKNRHSDASHPNQASHEAHNTSTPMTDVEDVEVLTLDDGVDNDTEVDPTSTDKGLMGKRRRRSATMSEANTKEGLMVSRRGKSGVKGSGSGGKARVGSQARGRGVNSNSLSKEAAKTVQ
ncbi:actin-domain-containing protein [Cantharellus anzutake]|uniref:actin-domain-containing protein n=1 Tax=Cantharellus anzutake TaxID=1750568 RepID=UPI0019036D24|nr:actin-domain-containing protein [Cantharellus anzutake]KAF8332777.1 actin-domain-containing protein [Cantharellus anzutake]